MEFPFLPELELENTMEVKNIFVNIGLLFSFLYIYFFFWFVFQYVFHRFGSEGSGRLSVLWFSQPHSSWHPRHDAIFFKLRTYLYVSLFLVRFSFI